MICGLHDVVDGQVAGQIADTELFYNKKRDRFAAEMREFIDAVQGKGEVAATGEQGVILMQVLDAIYRSSELNQEVTL